MIDLYHFFELTLTLDNEKFSELLNEFGNELTYFRDDKYYDNTLSDKGIAVVYHDKPYKKKVKLIVKPDLIRDDKLNSGNIEKLIQKLEKRIDRYFHSEYELNDFTLHKMGIVADIDVHDRKKAADYMRAIQRIGKVKGFSPSKDSINNVSFCLEGNSNGIEFTIYDLEEKINAHMDEADSSRKELNTMTENSEGILRTEVWLAANTIQSFSNELLVSEQISSLLQNSESIFLSIFKRIIPYGDFYKKKEALEIIQQKVIDRKLRYKMLRLLALVPKKKSLLLAQKAANCRRIKEVMSEFYEIGLSPVTLSKRHEVKYLENLYAFLEN